MKNKVIIVLVGLCIALGSGMYFFERAYEKQKEYATSFEETITGLQTDIKKERLRLNDSISLYMAEAQTLAFSKKNLEAKYSDLLKASKTRPKDVNSVTGVSTQAHKVDTVTCFVDTFGGIKAGVYDEWAKIDVEITKERKAIFDYSFRDSLTIMTIQKKHSILFGLIKWREHESTKVISHNPNADISTLQTITIIK
jgi:phage host-nuclease inhibitor protein Gam